jgi:hypothetical protein
MMKRHDAVILTGLIRAFHWREEGVLGFVQAWSWKVVWDINLGI